MSIFEGVPEDISPGEFFTEKLPGAFEREISEAEISRMEGTTLKVVFDVAGDAFGLTVTDAKALEVSEGTLDGPDIEIGLNEDGWKKTASGALGNALDVFTDFTKLADRARYDAIKAVKGKVNLVLELPGGESFEAVAKFAGADSPEATVNAELGSWQRIMAGTTQAVTAFMQGELKVSGDMPLAMQLNTVM